MNHGYFPGWETEKNIEVIELDGITKVFVKGKPYMAWESGDEACRRIAIVQLYECGICTQEELAHVFELHVRSVQRYIVEFAREGMRGLLSQRSGPRTKWKITPRLRAKILLIALKEGNFKLEAIQKRLEEWNERVSLPSIREVLLENGLIAENINGAEKAATQGELFDGDEKEQLYLNYYCDVGYDRERGGIFLEERTNNTDGKEVGCGCSNEYRSVEIKARRYYSPAQREYLDRLEQGDYNTYAGGLLFVPLLERYNILPTLRRVISIPTYEGYSLEELCLTLFYLDVFGFRSMEDFKRAYREEFGMLIGRTCSPSHFTLRRFLHRVRRLGIGEKLIDEFALEYLKSGMARWGVMYIDGHFLPYYGVYPITKGWHGVRKIPMKGSYNFLAVDDRFNPWMFLIRSSSEDLLQKIPEIIEKAKWIGKEAGVNQKELEELIVVFDREGYSAELFRYLDGKESGEGRRRAIFITWAKYSDKWVNDILEEKFDKTVTVTYEIKKPEEIKYFDTKRTMNKYGKMRTIVIQSGKGKKRAAIYTNGKEEEISSERIVQLICRRWGQENLIKELMYKHIINYSPGYVTEQLEEQPMIDNPKVKELKKQKARRASDLNKLKVQLADNMLEKSRKKAKQEKLRKSEHQILAEIIRVDHEILLLTQEIEELPEQVRFDVAHDGKRLLQLNYEKKRFLDCIKVFTYNIKEKMCQHLLNYYDREKEILPALSMIVERGGDIRLEGEQLRVRLRRLKNPEVNYAARHLCADLNRMKPTTLDGFRLPIHYEVQ